MSTLHTFGCSITQGFALPDVVKPAVDKNGKLLTDEQIKEQGIHWSDIHLYKPSQHAWPQVLGDHLGMNVNNYARRGACFQQIARQCAVGVKDIKPDDTVIVMWTYLSRLSLQWPARTSVPFANIVEPKSGWQTVILGFNKFFGLERSTKTELTGDIDLEIQKYIEGYARDQIDPKGTYNRYYNNLVLQQMTDGFLRSTGARVIHLSVETQSVLTQIEIARKDLGSSLRDPYNIPNPNDWYTLDVDYNTCMSLHDESIPKAENDMHPSVTHHLNFAADVYEKYFD
jgi:hypothetical protein